MKPIWIKNLLVLILVCIACSVIAQPPPVISTSAVAKDPLGNVARNRPVYVKVAIYQTSPINGAKVWEESHQVTSGDDGIFTIPIGKGTLSPGIMLKSIAEIDWGNGPFFINYKVAVAPSIAAPWWLPADNYIDQGTTQMVSVPYAMFAGNASVTNVNTSIQPGPLNTFLITDSLGNVNWQTPQAAQQSVTTVTNLNVNLYSGTGQNLEIEANTTAVVIVDLKGVEIGDPILVAPQADYPDWAIYSSWVSAPGKVSVRFANYTDKKVVVYGSQYKIVVIK